ncbi:spore cortex-lytic enzyme [Desulfuribacillus alkaliarsenatis]|uniref:Spore cortex-lytic enzyme n=1 Tax=Desulfuribacillus alkaliarsenatis TaxID=766136 RepID=A0A1E5FZM5_9FIRM|nr:spore cortex-lytic enzyme [Desulfuribacillus alkaliarsenatis]OEF96031.1 spore cortex-lytic enzyme [Desulfuribacillus alkaliarsenatis]
MTKKLLIGIAITALVVSFIVVDTGILQFRDAEETFSNRNLSMGSRGDDVSELQTRLQELGYYTANIDGIFGHQTLYAVRRYQQDYGLKVDGIVGPQTRGSLEQNTQGQPPGQAQQAGEGEATTAGQFNNQDLQLMANAVYGEARGEPYIGQVAVAAVVLNRLRSETFPNTVSGVIFEPRAFTAVADGQIWLEPNDTARRAVQDAINGWDPSGGALYYFNPDTATSGWIWTRPQRKKIGKHIFCD